MPTHEHEKSGGNFRAGAIVLVFLAAVTIGLGVAGDAVAIDQPNQHRKADKKQGVVKPKQGVVQPRQGAPGANQVRANQTAVPKRDPATSTTNARIANPTANPNAAKDKAGNNRLTNSATANPKGAATTNSRFANPKGGATANSRFANPNAPGARNANFAGSRIANARTFNERRTLRVDHRRDILFARLRLPPRPLPGERGFTGVPPATERRYAATEMMFQVGPNVSQQVIDNAARRLGLNTIGSQSSGLAGGTVLHFRIADGRAVADVVRALEAERIGIAQPNYVFQLYQDAEQDGAQDKAQDSDQDTDLAGQSNTARSEQYIVDKLRLAEVHKVATGSNVLVAVIDSQTDIRHPDLAGAIVEQFDAVGRADTPHTHGTGMVGAIAAHRKLLGIAPAAKILAVHAFSTTTRQSPEATTRHILAGLDWAIAKGARIINMSFAGPYDPMLQVAMKNAHAKGVVLIAAVGNLGAKSPPLFPAADPNVIAVTATDQDDTLFNQANQGPHVAVAAPGVDIMVPAPNNAYQITTGTSVAAAHVSGIVALLLERHPTADAATIFEVLTSSARKVGDKTRDDQYGWGLVDPVSALEELDVRMADNQVAAVSPPAAPKAAAPKAAAPKAALPKPASVSVR